MGPFMELTWFSGTIAVSVHVDLIRSSSVTFLNHPVRL